MITELKKDQMDKIKHLFKESKDTSIPSCLQGVMGKAYVADENNPLVAQIINGDFCFFGGDANCPQAKELVKHIPSDFHSDELLIVIDDERWVNLIKDYYQDKTYCVKRYAIKKDEFHFDKENLLKLSINISNEYQIKKIDKELYYQIVNKEWCQDLCRNYKTDKDFIEKGLGFVILLGDEIVAGASSYSSYIDGIEVEIITSPNHRNKGLATVIGATLILYCLENNIHPSWDAANLTSVQIAEKLGYVFDHEYDTYVVKAK